MDNLRDFYRSRARNLFFDISSIRENMPGFVSGFVCGAAWSVTTAVLQLGKYPPLEDRITQISKLVDNLRDFYRSSAQNLFFDISSIRENMPGFVSGFVCGTAWSVATAVLQLGKYPSLEDRITQISKSVGI